MEYTASTIKYNSNFCANNSGCLKTKLSEIHLTKKTQKVRILSLRSYHFLSITIVIIFSTAFIMEILQTHWIFRPPPPPTKKCAGRHGDIPKHPRSQRWNCSCCRCGVTHSTVPQNKSLIQN